MSGSYPYGPRAVGMVGPGGYFQPRLPVLPAQAPYGYPARDPRLSLDLVQLAPIFPAPVRDFRTLDFTRLINNPTVPITEVTWDCMLNPDTPVYDPTPLDRLIEPPVIDMPEAQSTTQMFGDGVDGAHYVLTATATLSDHRILVMRGTLACLAEPLVPEPEVPTGVVAFDYNKFVTLFPEFASVTSEQAHAYWSMACEILRNDGRSVVENLQEREEILLLLTAHICALFGGPQGGGGFGPQITGTINSKSVNGVSISGGGLFPGVSGTQAWYQLTRYGQLAWMKLRAYRLFYYVPGPQRDVLSPFTSWPWKIGGMGGWDSGGWGLGAVVAIPGPPGPTGPTGGGGGAVADQFSIVGAGTQADPLRVRRVYGGSYDIADPSGAAPVQEATGVAAPRRVRRPRGRT